MKSLGVGLAVCAVFLPAALQAQNRAVVISKGPGFELKKVLKYEGTTVVLFMQDTSVMEDQFLTDLQKQLPQSDKVGLAVVRLKNLTAPSAVQYSITATPTAIVYDRFAHELARTSQPDDIRAAVRKGTLMARIKWIDEDDPKAPQVYGAPAEALKHGLPGIVKTMALRPDAYQMFNIMSSMHFSDGFLKRREHEMIAAYVSSLNKCKF